MRFEQLKGNDSLKTTLAAMVNSGRIPHAILLHEDDGGGAFPLCIAFLQDLYCDRRDEKDSCGACPSCNKISKLIHPDVHFIFPTVSSQLSLNYIREFRELAISNPEFKESDLASALKIEGKNLLISVAESKQLLSELSLSALEGGYRAVVIYLPEKMNAEAANKLLKMIEEPPALTQFLLITHKPERVLGTISSRCQRIRVNPAERRAQISEFERADLFSELMENLLARNLMNCIETGEAIAALPSRESAKAFCNYAADNIRYIFLAQMAKESELSRLGPFPEEVLGWADRCPKTFARKALAVFDKTKSLIDRNVNQKVLFTDMVDRLYILL